MALNNPEAGRIDDTGKLILPSYRITSIRYPVNHRGQRCVLFPQFNSSEPFICQEGYCHECEIWRVRHEQQTA